MYEYKCTVVKVVDGDTVDVDIDLGFGVWMRKQRIRMYGIDAPESNQTCLFQGKEWRCGWEATNALSNIVGKHWVTCTKIDVDRYKRVIAVCRVGPINLNAWMVKNGWAVAYRKYSSDYVADEEFSRSLGKGLWRGKFIMPWAW